MGRQIWDEGIKKLCSAIVIMAAKDYHTKKNQRGSIMRFIRSEWGSEIIECSEYPNLSPELFRYIAESEKIKRYKGVDWERCDIGGKRKSYAKRKPRVK